MGAIIAWTRAVGYRACAPLASLGVMPGEVSEASRRKGIQDR
jgi:hypothetical protein